MKVLKNNLAKNDIFVISGYGPFILLWWEVQQILAQQYTPSDVKGKKVNFITSKTNGYANDPWRLTNQKIFILFNICGHWLLDIKDKWF
jgi:hypothetical protein